VRFNTGASILLMSWVSIVPATWTASFGWAVWAVSGSLQIMKTGRPWRKPSWKMLILGGLICWVSSPMLSEEADDGLCGRTSLSTQGGPDLGTDIHDMIAPGVGGSLATTNKVLQASRVDSRAAPTGIYSISDIRPAKSMASSANSPGQGASWLETRIPNGRALHEVTNDLEARFS